MGKSQRTKGFRGEREAVAVLNELGFPCRRVPLSGAQRGWEGDIILERTGERLEVKRRQAMGKYLADNFAVLSRADRGEWYITIRLADVTAFAEGRDRGPTEKA